MILAPVTARLNCGHTYLIFPDGYWDKMNDKYDYLPLRLFFNKNKAYIMHNLSNQTEIPAGAELIEINEIPVQQIIYNLLSVMPTDGNITAYKYHCMNELEFGLFPGYNHFPHEYTIRYKICCEDSTPKTVRIKALSRDEIVNNRNNLKIEYGNYESYSFKVIDSLNIPVIQYGGGDNQVVLFFFKGNKIQFQGL